MRALIGNSLIPKLQPQKRQYDIRDTKLKGFLIRVNPTGKMVYVCEFKRGRRINLGTVGVITPAQARDKAIAALADATKGIDPGNPKKKKSIITLREFIKNEYQPWVIEHRKSGAKTVAHIERCFFDLFGDKPLTEISPILLDQWRTQKLKNGSSKETVNRYIATFKAALSKAVLWDFINSHPLEKLKLLRSDRSSKIRFLSPKEEVRLRETIIDRDNKIKSERANANKWRQEREYELYPDLNNQKFADHLHPMILVSINTGLRQGELFTLRWDNVNLEQALLTIEGAYAKSGKTRHIPLNTEALQALKAWREQTTDTRFVFASKDGKPFDNVKKAWAGILKKAEIDSFRWHDMRHHFASRLVMVGVDLNTVRELLGHSDMSMTLRYAHLAPEHKANAVEKLVTNMVASETK